MYRVAFDRLTFQDDYLFKFSAVFLTAYGGLALLAQWAITQSEVSRHLALGLTSLFGFIVAVVWCLWTNQNDYWHSVWKGALIDIEKNHLKTQARLFATDHEQLAKAGGRSKPCFRGHHLALLLPVILAIAWGIALAVAMIFGCWCHGVA